MNAIETFTDILLTSDWLLEMVKYGKKSKDESFIHHFYIFLSVSDKVIIIKRTFAGQQMQYPFTAACWTVLSCNFINKRPHLNSQH